jgi:hypothetical protein
MPALYCTGVSDKTLYVKTFFATISSFLSTNTNIGLIRILPHKAFLEPFTTHFDSLFSFGLENNSESSADASDSDAEKEYEENFRQTGTKMRK